MPRAREGHPSSGGNMGAWSTWSRSSNAHMAGAQGVEKAQDEVSNTGGGRITQGPAGQGKDSGLFSAVDLRQRAECPGGRTAFHPE